MSLGDYGLRPKIGGSNADATFSFPLQSLSVNPFANALFNAKFKLEGSVPLPTLPKPKQQTGPTRSQLLQWLSSLSKEELLSATLIENPEFIEKLIRNLPSDSNKLLHLPSGRSFTFPESIRIAPSINLMGWLRVALTAETQLYLEEENLNVKKLIQWLNIVSGRRVFDLPVRQFKIKFRSGGREKSQQNLLWFNSASFHNLDQWLACEIEKSIVSYYFSPHDRFQRLKSLRRHMIERKAQKYCFSALEIPILNMRDIQVADRLKMSEGLKNYEQSMKDSLQQQVFNTEIEKKKKRKRKNRNKKSKKEENSLDKMQDRDRLNPEYEKSEDFKLESMETLEILQTADDFDVMVPLLETKSESIQEFERVSVHDEPMEQTSSKLTVEFNTCEYTHSESVNATYFTIKNEQQYLQDSNCTEDRRRQRKSSHSHIGSTTLSQQKQELTDKHDSQSITVSHKQFSDGKSKRRRKRKGQKNQNKNVEEFKAGISSIIINKQLNNMLDSLSMQSNSTYESKVIAFQRVRYFSKSLYPFGESVLFGSNAVGLSLPNSDIDIMLVDMNCKTKEDICECLAQIAIYINAMGWVTSCSTYFGAKVPLVKLQINPSIPYFTPKCKSDYFSVDPYSSCYLDMKDPSKGVPVKIDITITTEGGRVSGSTELMRNSLQNNTSLQRVLLALKYTLSVRGLSENFKGGIGSYCLFVMVAAFFKQFQEKRQSNDCEILLDILKFYGQEFQNHLKVVTLVQGSKSFIPNEQALQKYGLPDQLLLSNPLKIIDPLYDKLMSSSCFQFHSIKSEWRAIRAQILSIEELVQSQIEVCFNNQADVGKILGNRKSMQKWANKLMSRMDYSVSKIIARNF